MINDIDDLQALVNDFNAAIDAIADYSADPVANIGLKPTLETYQKLRITGIDSDMAESINSVLADDDVVISANAVRTQTQALVDTYNSLNDFVSEQSGASAPVLSDYALLGITQLSEQRAEDFLTSHLPGLEVADVASATKLAALADAVNALFYTADITDASTAATDGSAITVEQLGLLGQTVSDAQLASVRAFIASKVDSDVATVSSLTQLIDAVITASDRVKAYSEDATAALDTDNGGLGAPQSLDYEVVLAGTGVSVSDVDALNVILADSDVTVGVTDLQAEVKELAIIHNTPV